MPYTSKLIKTIVVGTLFLSPFAIEGHSVQAESTSHTISKSEQQTMTSMLYKHQLTIGRLSDYKDINKLRLISTLHFNKIINIPNAEKPYVTKEGFEYTVHKKSEIDNLTKEMFNTIMKPKAIYSDDANFLPSAMFKKSKYYLFRPEVGGGIVRYSIQPQTKFKKLSNELYYSTIDTYALSLVDDSLKKIYPQVKTNPTYDWGKKTYLKNTRTTWNSLQKKLTPKESTGFIILKMNYVKGKKQWQLLEIEKDHKPLSENEMKKRVKWYK